MNIVENRLQALGITLGEPELPVGNYLGCKKFRELLYVSGRVSDLKGEVGTDVNEEQAKHAAHDTVLLILSIVKEGIKNLDLIC